MQRGKKVYSALKVYTLYSALKYYSCTYATVALGQMAPSYILGLAPTPSVQVRLPNWKVAVMYLYCLL